MAVEEERELSEAYRTTKRVQPEGQGLNGAGDTRGEKIPRRVLDEALDDCAFRFLSKFLNSR